MRTEANAEELPMMAAIKNAKRRWQRQVLNVGRGSVGVKKVDGGAGESPSDPEVASSGAVSRHFCRIDTLTGSFLAR